MVQEIESVLAAHKVVPYHCMLSPALIRPFSLEVGHMPLYNTSERVYLLF